MRCPNCGHEVSEGQAFCTNCGAQLPQHEDKPQAEEHSGKDHASARPNICPFCGSPLPEDSEFCPNCGKRIAGDDADSARESISHTQAMPVIPEAPQRKVAVPAPPQNPYTSGSDKPAGTTEHKHSKAPLVATGAAVLVAVAALVVVIALGVGPFGANTIEDTQEAQNAEVTSTTNTNESDTTNDNENTSSADNETSDTDNSSSANTSSSTADTSNTTSSANTNTTATQSDDSNTGSTLTSGTVSITNGYVYNSNSTYGYSLRVPTTFTLTGSDANGNATLTDSASPCVISISVDDNPNGYSVDEALADASRGSTSGAYTAEGNGWYVFSDEPNGTVYYIMSYVRQGRTISLRFTYPTSAKSQCDPIIESVQPTFSVN